MDIGELLTIQNSSSRVLGLNSANDKAWMNEHRTKS